MQHVIFEVLPHPDGRASYLAIAARLRPRMEQSGGCLTLERFDRDDGSGWMLSMQKWQDEAALARWRAEASHRDAQQRGREHVFADYRLRVALSRRYQASRAEDATLAGAPALGFAAPIAAAWPRAVAVLEWTEAAAPLPSAAESPGARRYTAIVDRSRHALVTASAPAAELADWCARLLPALQHSGLPFALSLAEVERDYGMFERTEAPLHR